MALKGTFDTKAGSEPTFTAEFTNGTVTQLRELALFLQTQGFTLPEGEAEKLSEVVRVGIAWLERLRKENSDKHGVK